MMIGQQTVNGGGNSLYYQRIYILSTSGTSRTGTFNGSGNVTINGAHCQMVRHNNKQYALRIRILGLFPVQAQIHLVEQQH